MYNNNGPYNIMELNVMTGKLIPYGYTYDIDIAFQYINDLAAHTDRRIQCYRGYYDTPSEILKKLHLRWETDMTLERIQNNRVVIKGHVPYAQNLKLQSLFNRSETAIFDPYSISEAIDKLLKIS